MPLHMNHLSGRMLRMPPKAGKSREILLLYGHHASLERMFGIAENFNKYGGVTIPDLPGFGGMDSFYTIESEPTLDNFADYLASFVKLQYNRRQVTIVGTSFSFMIVTRMLQKYPQLIKRVDLLVSFAGFAHRDDFRFKPLPYWSLRTLAAVTARPIPARIFRYTVLNKWSITLGYKLVANSHTKMKGADKDMLKQRIAYEIELWHMNDVRTRMKTITQMLTADLCGKQIDLPLYHVSVPDDRYFNNKVVEQHMRIIFNDFQDMPCKIIGHMPTVVATAKEANPFIPLRLRKLLSE